MKITRLLPGYVKVELFCPTELDEVLELPFPKNNDPLEQEPHVVLLPLTYYQDAFYARDFPS